MFQDNNALIYIASKQNIYRYIDRIIVEVLVTIQLEKILNKCSNGYHAKIIDLITIDGRLLTLGRNGILGVYQSFSSCWVLGMFFSI